MGVSLYMLKTGLPMQQGFVAFLQPHFSRVKGSPITVAIQGFEIIRANPADIPKYVAQQIGEGIVTGQLRLNNNAGQLM